MKAARQVGIILVLLGAFLGAAPALAQQTTTVTVAKTAMSFQCGKSRFGECAFVLYSSDCKEDGNKNGRPVLLCKYELISEFSLKSGESKTFKDLPANVKQCHALPNVKPKFPDCIR